MPFTFSHPALIIPLRRLPAKHVSMTGLVIGSIVPDFEKFIKMSGGNIYSHTYPGILWFNLPLALGLAFIFHLVVRDTLIDNLPMFFRARLEKYKRFKWSRRFKRNPGVVAASIMFGAFFHIILDSVTHEGASNMDLFPFLLNYSTFWKVTLMWVVILDLTLSVVGLFCVIYALVKLPATPVKPKPIADCLRFWTSVAFVTVVIAALKFFFGGPLANYWQITYIAIGAGLMGVLLSAIIWKKATVN